MNGRYYIVQPYGRKADEAMIVESFDAVEDAYEVLDMMAERLDQQGIDPESLGFKVTDRNYRAVERPRLMVQ
jgi:hypothetical protein